MKIEHTVGLYTEMAPAHSAVRDYLTEHYVDVVVLAEWEGADQVRSNLTGPPPWKLKDWQIVTIKVDGFELNTQDAVPDDFPMQGIIWVANSPATRRELERMGPKARKR